jgi:YidC/Oxa1 family membrane protein insertase
VHSLGTIGHFIMTPLYYAISFVLVTWHKIFSVILPSDSGAAWALSIVGLTVVIRAALIPLFVKQINSSRNMQLIQPKVKELQKKYGHDREKLAAETMALYRETGTNPFASCLPILVQMPIFLALFRLLNGAAHEKVNGVLTSGDVTSIHNAHLFGAKIAESFTHHTSGNVQILAGILVVAMTATTFLTQRQLMSKNMPADAMSGPYAQQQKLLLYILPVAFAVGGIAFPVGVLLYWTTTNLWTMGQQFYVIRRNPAPGTPAFEAKKKRDLAKGREVPADGAAAVAVVEAPRPAPRQQPKKQTREQRKKAGGNRAPGTGSPSDADPDQNQQQGESA